MKIKKWYQILTTVSPSRTNGDIVAEVCVMIDGGLEFRRAKTFVESATVEQIREWFSVIQTEATQYVTFELGSEI
jgi:hypothetical protein